MLIIVLLSRNLWCLQVATSDSRRTLQRAVVAIAGSSTTTALQAKGSGLKVNCKQWSKSSLQRTAAFGGAGQVFTACSSQPLHL
jgi:hypothetical protein